MTCSIVNPMPDEVDGGIEFVYVADDLGYDYPEGSPKLVHDEPLDYISSQKYEMVDPNDENPIDNEGELPDFLAILHPGRYGTSSGTFETLRNIGQKLQTKFFICRI